jgi:hypothetical protein
MSHFIALDISSKPLTQDGVAFMNYHRILNMYKQYRVDLNIPKHINAELVALLDQYNLYLRFAELFYTPANRTSLIHVDSEPDDYIVPNNMAKINYIGGGGGSMMHWYEPIVYKPYEPTNRNKFISFQPNEVNLIDSANLTGYNIAQTGIPHNITTTFEPRFCVSMTLAIRGKIPKLIPYELMTSLLGNLI